MPLGLLLFLCVSRINVYATLSAGWFSNSKYALLGALRSVAQTISYEVSLALILIRLLITLGSFDFTFIIINSHTPKLFLQLPLAIM